MDHECGGNLGLFNARELVLCGLEVPPCEAAHNGLATARAV
jgi:hypothetical protein